MRADLPPDGSIDAGLLMLLLITPRGVVRTYHEIATACGCSHTAIQKIEARALRKLQQGDKGRKLAQFINQRSKQQ